MGPACKSLLLLVATLVATPAYGRSDVGGLRVGLENRVWGSFSGSAPAPGDLPLQVPETLQATGLASTTIVSGSGLFLQPDPEGFADSVNPYAGMGWNPVNYRDPTGRKYGEGGRAAGAGLAMGRRLGLYTDEDLDTIEEGLAECGAACGEMAAGLHSGRLAQQAHEALDEAKKADPVQDFLTAPSIQKASVALPALLIALEKWAARRIEKRRAGSQPHLLDPVKAPELGATGLNEGPDRRTVAEWLPDNPQLVDEMRRKHKESPEWQGIDPDKDPVFYRPRAAVKKIRRMPGESGDNLHHPHALSLGGPPGQTPTPTNDTFTKKNPQHSSTTGLHGRVSNRVKKRRKR